MSSTSLTGSHGYSFSWAEDTVRRYQEAHKDAAFYIQQVYPRLTVAILVRWLATPALNEHWRNYKKGVKYVEACGQYVEGFYKGNYEKIDSYYRRIFNKEIIQRLRPGLDDSIQMELGL
jgi:hypothetical protein